MTRQVISFGGPLEQTYGYSRAVRAGAHVHIAGTAARGEALAGDAYVQTKTFSAQSAAHLSGPERVWRTWCGRSFTSPPSTMLTRGGRAHREVFGDVRPASTMVQVVALVRPEMRVEIEAYAVIDAAA